MRRAILILSALALVACVGMAQPTNVDVIYDTVGAQTLIWDDVTADIDGVPYLPTDTITYEIYAYNAALFGLDDQALANVEYVGAAIESTGIIDFSVFARGWYYVGVRSVVDDGQGTIEYSLIGWSYDPVTVDPTLRFAYWVDQPIGTPPSPLGLRDLGM